MHIKIKIILIKKSIKLINNSNKWKLIKKAFKSVVDKKINKFMRNLLDTLHQLLYLFSWLNYHFLQNTSLKNLALNFIKEAKNI